jgi:hypothetical protein
MKIKRQIKLDTEEKYKLANELLFSYAFDNNLYGEVKPNKEIFFQKNEGDVMIYSDFNLKNVTIKTDNLREANKLEQQLKRINKN